VEIRCNVEGDGHGGGDERMVNSFLRDVRQFELNPSHGLTSATASLQSHLMAFAAEHSRLNEGFAVNLSDFAAEAEGIS